MWGLIFLAGAGVGAMLLAYSLGRDYERRQRAAVLRHPAVRWEPCDGCDLAWGSPTACGFAGCVDGYVVREVRDGG